MLGPMVDTANPYQSPSESHHPIEVSGDTPAASATSELLQTQKVLPTFTLAYLTSLFVGIAVVLVWLLFLIRAATAGVRRTRPPDVAELLFILLSTVPSILTCMAFSVCYCHVFRVSETRRIWPAITFGIFSGLTFNAMTAIEVIEYFFDW